VSRSLALVSRTLALVSQRKTHMLAAKPIFKRGGPKKDFGEVSRSYLYAILCKSKGNNPLRNRKSGLRRPPQPTKEPRRDHQPLDHQQSERSNAGGDRHTTGNFTDDDETK
jgi:hypothetical protein